MSALLFSFIGIVVFLMITEWLLPSFLRPDNLFGVTVAPDTRQQPAGRALIRKWRVITGGASLLAIGVMVVATELFSANVAVFVHAGVLLLMVLAEVALIGVFHQQALAFAIPTTGAVRATAISQQSIGPLVPWWWEVLPLGVIAATAITLATQYTTSPAIIPIHWDLNGHANGFADKSILSFYQLVWTQIGLWVLLTGIVATLRITRFGNNASAGAAIMRMVIARFLYAVKAGVIGLLGALAVITTLSAVQGHTPSTTLLVLPFGLVALMLVSVIIIFVRYGQSGWRIANGEVNTRIPGDGTPDSKWLWGLIYVNRDDPALLVERRIGLGVTFNFGHPASWLILGAILAVPIGLIVFRVLARAH